MKYLGVIPYTGNKTRLIPVLHELFPVEISTLYDVFCGSMSVSLSLPCRVVAIDAEQPLISMYTMLQEKNSLNFVQSIIDEYNLTPSDPDAYMKARSAYNKTKSPELLYVLIMFSFCNMYRTNLMGEFNAPFGNNRFRGKRGGYKDQWKERFDLFKSHTDLTILNGAYNIVDPDVGDFVYCDPPYLITGAQYNTKWNEREENDLYEWLDSLNEKGVKFGLSNVTHHAGKTNKILLNWASKYNTHELDINYKMNQIQNIDNDKTREVFVCNYEVKKKFTLDDL